MHSTLMTKLFLVSVKFREFEISVKLNSLTIDITTSYNKYLVLLFPANNSSSVHIIVIIVK